MADDEVVHPRWQSWVAENLAHGAEEDAIRDALVDEGLTPEQAADCIGQVQRSPVLGAVRSLAHRVHALELMLRLRREHRDAIPWTVERISLPEAETFRRRHWMPGVPVIITDLVTRWPAFESWSPVSLSERFGDVVQEVCVGRDSVERPDADWEQTARKMTIAELMTRLEGAGATNDVYVISKNGAWQNPGLSALLGDLRLPTDYFGATLEPKRMGLWIGPAGTHTPMHHDGDNSMFCQVVGRKRIRLAAPESVAMLDQSRGVYCEWDPGEALDGAPDRVEEVLLQPGEALFIPAGWWHQVDALDLSISVSILEFAWPNEHDWYKPGTALRGRPV